MPMPKPNRPGFIPIENINENKKDPVKMPSRIPRLNSTQKPLKSDIPSSREPKTVVEPKPNKTTATTTQNQTNSNPKLNSCGDTSNTQKRTLFSISSLLKPKGNQFADCKSISNLSTSTTSTKLSCETMSGSSISETTNAPKYLLKHLTCDERLLRVAERKKMIAFEVVQDKLREIQSKFIRTCESLTNVTTTETKGPFKFISLVKNDNCKLIVNYDDLTRMPQNLPSQSINDLKENVKEILVSNLDLLENYFADLKKLEMETDWRKAFESIHDKLEHHQERKKEGLMKIIDGLCKEPSIPEKELTRTLDKLKEIENKFNILKLEKQEEISSLVAQHKAELTKEIQTSKDTVAKVRSQSNLSVQAVLSAKEKTIDSKNKKIIELLKEIDNLKICIIELNCGKRKVEKKEISLQQQITNLKQKLRRSKTDVTQLKTKLEKAEKTPSITTYFHNKTDKFPTMITLLEQKKKEDFITSYGLKLLEENNKCSKRLAIKQEEKIAELNAKIAQHQMRKNISLDYNRFS